jgi:hypothetical protein
MDVELTKEAGPTEAQENELKALVPLKYILSWQLLFPPQQQQEQAAQCGGHQQSIIVTAY